MHDLQQDVRNLSGAVIKTHQTFGGESGNFVQFMPQLAMNPSRKFDVIVYGSYGYTGRLIVDECKKSGVRVLLSGRREDALTDHSKSSDLPFQVVNLDDTESLQKLLSIGHLVIHCAGPFKHTSEKMVRACLRTGTHYLDITGEVEVFEFLQKLDREAKQHNIIIMPGTGFDVVPTDCLAVHLKQKLPTATHLELGFAMSKGGLSRGTARTMIDNLGQGSLVREGGTLKKIPLGSRVKTIDFGSFQASAMCIPWGDVSTAFRSTGIPNIEVYSAVPRKMIFAARASRWLNFILRTKVVKNFLDNRVGKQSFGPSPEGLESGRCYLWGRVRDDLGNTVETRLETVNGYKLTAEMSTSIALRILNEKVRPGYFTPAQYFGPTLMIP